MIENALALVVATLILVLIPGPNAALVVANTLRHGPRAGVTTVVGTTLGIAAQLSLVVLGMAAIIELAAGALAVIKWAGVVYLIALGVQTWREPVTELGAVTATPAVFWRGFMIAALNPKTLLFNAAFLPQFVPQDSTLAALASLTLLFLGVLLVGDLLWVAFADSARRWLGRFAQLRNRLTGGFLVAAGAALALSRRATN